MIGRKKLKKKQVKIKRERPKRRLNRCAVKMTCRWLAGWEKWKTDDVLW